MNLVRIGMVTVAIALLAIACASRSPETTNRSQPANAASPVTSGTPDELATTRANFAKNCSVCHGDDGKGGLVKIESETIKVPNLREGHAVTHTDERLAKQISNGDDEMPAFKDKLSPEEINALVKLIRVEFQGK